MLDDILVDKPHACLVYSKKDSTTCAQNKKFKFKHKVELCTLGTESVIIQYSISLLATLQQLS